MWRRLPAGLRIKQLVDTLMKNMAVEADGWWNIGWSEEDGLLFYYKLAWDDRTVLDNKWEYPMDPRILGGSLCAYVRLPA